MKKENPPTYHPAAPQVAKHSLAQLEMAGQPGGITTALHILTMLKEILHQLPKSHVKVSSRVLSNFHKPIKRKTILFKFHFNYRLFAKDYSKL